MQENYALIASETSHVSFDTIQSVIIVHKFNLFVSYDILIIVIVGKIFAGKIN